LVTNNCIVTALEIPEGKLCYPSSASDDELYKYISEESNVMLFLHL